MGEISEMDWVQHIKMDYAQNRYALAFGAGTYKNSKHPLPQLSFMEYLRFYENA